MLRWWRSTTSPPRSRRGSRGSAGCSVILTSWPSIGLTLTSPVRCLIKEYTWAVPLDLEDKLAINFLHFVGQCTYILNMDCELATWSVYGKFENCSGVGMRGSCLQSITVVYESSAIELQRGWSINYLGEKIDFFETQQHDVPFFHFDLDENLNLVVTMENGAAVIWDGLYGVQVRSPYH